MNANQIIASGGPGMDPNSVQSPLLRYVEKHVFECRCKCGVTTTAVGHKENGAWIVDPLDDFKYLHSRQSQHCKADPHKDVTVFLVKRQTYRPEAK